MKWLPLFFLSISQVFSSYIGLVHNQPWVGSTAVPHFRAVQERLEKEGHRVELADINKPACFRKFDILISQIYLKALYPFRHKTILYMQEPPVVVKKFQTKAFYNSFLLTFCWDHDNVDGTTKSRKAFFPNYDKIHPEFIPFAERKFSCLINSNLSGMFNHGKELYSARAKVARFYNKHHFEDLNLYGGRGWDKKQFPNYKGRCDDKFAEMRNHKFCFVYENWDNDMYYISEKILHCLESRCVPIYLGSSKISKYIPEDCYVDARSFKNVAAIHEFISNMDEETWLTYIHAIEKFDRSESAIHFTKEAYLDQLASAVEDVT